MAGDVTVKVNVPLFHRDIAKKYYRKQTNVRKYYYSKG